MAVTKGKAWAVALVFSCCGTVGAASSVKLDDVALRAYARRPWDKAALMNRTVELGRHHGVAVVAEFPCGDVCPQYTVRIIHYQLPADVSCASVGGLERPVLVPLAIAMISRTLCIPATLVESGQYETR